MAKTKDNTVAMILDQINVVQSDYDWWVDSGASKHVCKDRSFFKTLDPVEDGKCSTWATHLLLMSKE